MNPRITKELRVEIQRNASKELFAKEFAELLEQEKALGDRIFNKHICKPEQYALMQKLPAEFFASRNSLDIKIDEGYISVLMSDYRRTPAFACSYSSVEIKDSSWLSDYDKLVNARSALLDKKGELKEQIGQVLLSVNTVNRLLEVWPEAKPFIPVHAFTGGTKNVPAVLVANLTSAMMAAGVNFGQPANA